LGVNQRNVSASRFAMHKLAWRQQWNTDSSVLP
jgi:hypothetical protein